MNQVQLCVESSPLMIDELIAESFMDIGGKIIDRVVQEVKGNIRRYRTNSPGPYPAAYYLLEDGCLVYRVDKANIRSSTMFDDWKYAALATLSVTLDATSEDLKAKPCVMIEFASADRRSIHIRERIHTCKLAILEHGEQERLSSQLTAVLRKEIAREAFVL